MHLTTPPRKTQWYQDTFTCWSITTKIEATSKRHRWCVLIILCVISLCAGLIINRRRAATPVGIIENATTTISRPYPQSNASGLDNKKEDYHKRVSTLPMNENDRERAPGLLAALLKSADDDAARRNSPSTSHAAVELGVPHPLHANNAHGDVLGLPYAYRVLVNTPCLVILAGKQSFKNYAVFSADSEDRGYTYSFLLPLTTMTWRRLGYGSVVLIVGSLQKWRDLPITNHILESTLEQGAIVVFLQRTAKHHSVMLTQTSRLFAAALVPFNDTSDTMLVTSDADIWPIHGDMFNIESNKTSVLSTNAFCCGDFRHKGSAYRMLPLTNIVASVDTWRQLILQKGALPTCPDDIVSYFAEEFGAVANYDVVKGENKGWFMDQHMASIWLAQWHREHGNESVRHIGRDIPRDRIDTNFWFPYMVHNLQDAHVLLGTHSDVVWRRVKPLLKLLFGLSSANYRLCIDYRDKFLQYFSPM